MKLHHVFHKHNPDFKNNIQNHKKTMWLFLNNSDLRKKNMDKLVVTSKLNEVPVVMLNYWYDTNKTQSRKERHAYLSHFESKCYKN